MCTCNQRKECFMSDDRKRSAGMTFLGLAVGFAAGALTILLSDPDNRRKVKEKTDELMEQGKEKTKETVDKVAIKLREATDKVQQKVHEVADKTQVKVKKEIDKTEEDLRAEG